MLKHLRQYLFFYILILAYLPGGPIGKLAILFSSFYAFWYLAFKKKIDLYVIFLLLIPSVALAPFGDEVAQSFFTRLLRNFQNVIVVGPLAISTNLFLALALPVRVLLKFSYQRSRLLVVFWIIAVMLALAGLFLSVHLGNRSQAGLTVGFRLALSIGAVLVPLCIDDRQAFYKQLDLIIFATVVLFVLGALSGYWIFIFVGFLPYFIKRCRPKILALVPFLYAVKLILGFDSTITILGTIIVSLLFFFFISISRRFRNLLSRRSFRIIMVVVPIFLTIYTLQLKRNQGGYDYTTISGLVNFKLVGDRKPIWDAAFDQIISSSFILVPSGRPLMVYFDWKHSWDYWENGAHNIFLEMGNQIGLLNVLLLFSGILAILVKAGNVLVTREDHIIYCCFISVYLVFGITGEALIYDGVGFLYWLLLGQFYRSGLLESSRA